MQERGFHGFMVSCFKMSHGPPLIQLAVNSKQSVVSPTSRDWQPVAGAILMTRVFQMPVPRIVPEKNAQAAQTRVVLVDDHVSLREMLRVILNIDGGYEIVGEAGSGLEALKICRATKPALVILDLALPELSGTHLLRLLQREAWDVRVVIYSGTADQQLMREALAESPHGFVRKEDSLSELRSALKAVVAGARHLSPWASRLLPQKSDDAMKALTATERAILHMVAEGLQTKEIADAMGVTVKTVEHHRQHLRDKLGLHDAVALTRFAMKHGMVSP